MMGTLATALAKKDIRTPEDHYRADVEGDIEKVNNIPKITEIRVAYHLKIPAEKTKDAMDAFSSYLISCPAAQSVMGCITIKDNLMIEELTI